MVQNIAWFDDSWETQVVKSEFDPNSMNAWPNLYYINSLLELVCNGVENVFLTHFTVKINHYLNACFSVVAYHVNSFMTIIYPSSNGYYCVSKGTLKLASWTWWWVQCCSVAFPGARYESKCNDFEIGYNRRFTTWKFTWKFCRICMTRSYQHESWP